MIETYTIKCAYPMTSKNEVEITSTDLIYTEAVTDNGKHLYIGIQTNSPQHEELIKNKCMQIANLFRDIDELLKTK